MRPEGPWDHHGKAKLCSQQVLDSSLSPSKGVSSENWGLGFIVVVGLSFACFAIFYNKVSLGYITISLIVYSQSIPPDLWWCHQG